MTHAFDPGYTGMSTTCNALSLDADGSAIECGEPRASLVHGMVPDADLTDAGRHLRAVARDGSGNALRPWSYVPCAVTVVERGQERLCIREAGHAGSHVQDAAERLILRDGGVPAPSDLWEAELLFRRGPSPVDGVRATPQEFVTWFQRIPAGRQLEVAEQMLDASETATSCLIFDHVRRLAGMESTLRALTDPAMQRLEERLEASVQSIEEPPRAVIIGSEGQTVDEHLDLDTLPYVDLPPGVTRVYFVSIDTPVEALPGWHAVDTAE